MTDQMPKLASSIERAWSVGLHLGRRKPYNARACCVCDPLALPNCCGSAVMCTGRLPRVVRGCVVACWLGYGAAAAATAHAQPMVTIQTPFRAVNDNFFERIGIGWTVRGPGFALQMGSFPRAVPQFGGFQPGAGIQGGVGFTGRGVSGNAFFNFAQGSQRTMVSQTPVVTLTNGQSALVADTSLAPFVISLVPAIPVRPPVLPWKQQLEGAIPRQMRPPAAPAAPAAARAAPLAANPDRMADGPAAGATLRQQIAAVAPVEPAAMNALPGGDPARASLAELRNQAAQQQAQRDAEAAHYLQRARQAQAQGNPGAARVYLQMAASRARGTLKQEIQAELAALGR